MKRPSRYSPDMNGRSGGQMAAALGPRGVGSWFGE